MKSRLRGSAGKIWDFVFQDFNLLDTLTISENIALALTINKVPSGEIDGRIQEMAVKLNITDILDKYPYQVSGGTEAAVRLRQGNHQSAQTDFGG